MASTMAAAMDPAPRNAISSMMVFRGAARLVVVLRLVPVARVPHGVDEDRARAPAGPRDQRDLAADAAQRVAGHGEAHADADRPLGAHERLEHPVSDLVGDAGAAVVDPHLEHLL